MHARAERVARPVFERQGRDRRQLRALRAPPPRPPRRGAGRVRLAQPPLARLRGQLRPRTAASPTTATRSSCSTAWPSRCTPPSSASACASASTARSASSCPAWPTSCAGCSRTPPTRASCATASPRAGRSTSWSRRPRSTTSPGPTAPPVVAADRPRRPGPYEPEPLREWRRGVGAGRVRRGGRQGARRRSASTCPAVIDGERGAHRGARSRRSTRPRSTGVVATSASCTAADADAAVAAARGGGAGVAARRRPSSGPAVLFRAADWMRERRDELAALEVLRGGQAVGPGRRRRLRGDRLLRVLRPRGAAPRRGRAPSSCSRRRARRTG